MMKFANIIVPIAIIGKLILSILICSYFWDSNELSQIQHIPILILSYTVVYIGLQLLTRKFSIVQNWWDWVYYAGLLSIMIPTFIATKDNQKLVHLITDYGTICLILPVFVDGWQFVAKAVKIKK